MDAQTEQFALLPDGKIVFAKDLERFVLLTLDESVRYAKALRAESYAIVGAVGTVDGTVRGICERPSLGQLVSRAVRLFVFEQSRAEKPVPPLAWLENLALLEDPRT